MFVQSVAAKLHRGSRGRSEQGGHVAFEWPEGASGWQLRELVAFIKRNNLYLAECHECHVLG